MGSDLKPLRRWTGPSGQEYELWPSKDLSCVGCAMEDEPSSAPDCKCAPCGKDTDGEDWILQRISDSKESS